MRVHGMFEKDMVQNIVHTVTHICSAYISDYMTTYIDLTAVESKGSFRFSFRKEYQHFNISIHKADV